MLARPLSLDNLKTSIPFWAWPNLLSLDAAIVALIWQWFLAKSFNLALNWQQELVLALTVWLIYILDRLFDGLKLDLSKAHSLRHEFYYQHYFEFAILALLILLTDVYFVATSLQISTIIFGLLLSGLVLLYGLGLHLLAFARAYKEIYIGILFSIGVSLVYLKDSSPELLLAIAFFAILASLNCLLISSWERNLDFAQNYHSGIFAPEKINLRITASLLVFILLSLALLIISRNYYYFAIFLSFSLLLFLDFNKDLLSNLSLRILVDLALFSPLLLIFL